jgi:glutathione synthase
LSRRDEEIARTVGRALLPRGLLLLGLDVIGDYLTEINVTSPTCFVEITEQSGFNVASMFLDTLEKEVANA